MCAILPGKVTKIRGGTHILTLSKKGSGNGSVGKSLEKGGFQNAITWLVIRVNEEKHRSELLRLITKSHGLTKKSSHLLTGGT